MRPGHLCSSRNGRTSTPLDGTRPHTPNEGMSLPAVWAGYRLLEEAGLTAAVGSSDSHLGTQASDSRPTGPDALDRAVVHEALSALYHNVRLAQAQLASCFPSIAALEALDERTEALRSLLLEAMDSLRPARPMPFGSMEARSYDVLRLRYIERLRISQVEEELSLSRRQVFRDLEQAENALAQVLASWAAQGDETATGPDSLSDELRALVPSVSGVGLAAVVSEALAVVSPLAQQSGRRIRLAGEIASSVQVLVDAAIFRQVLVQVLCSALQGARHDVLVGATVTDDSAAIAVRFPGQLGTVQERRVLDTQRIAASQGFAASLSSGTDTVEIGLHVELGGLLSVLVVEDNPGAVELYRRYLSGRGWQVHSVTDPLEACSAAFAARPDVIVLDIMMPKQDGWTVLQMLRRQPQTARTPVVICSVVEQPELASALGASMCLSKPVAQGDFISALDQCLRAAGRSR